MRERPAERVAHRRPQLAGAVAANTHARVSLAHAEGPANRCGAALLRAGRGAHNVGGAASLHTIHKGSRVPPFGTGGGEQPHLAGWPSAALCKGGARAKRAAPARLRAARAGNRASKAGEGKEATAARGDRKRRPLYEEGCRPRWQGGLCAGLHGNGKWYKEGAPANRGQDWPVHQSTEPLPPFLGVAHAGVGPYSRQPSRVFREGGEVPPVGHTALDPLRPRQEPARLAHSHFAKQILLDGRRAADPLEPARAPFHP